MKTASWVIALGMLLVVGTGCGAKKQAEPAVVPQAKGDLNMSDSEWASKDEKFWKERLSEGEFQILRNMGTEQAFTGDLWDHHEKGTYKCAGCGLELFSSEHKFDSGTGWPSYWKPLAEGRVAEEDDKSLFMKRTEILCSRCGGHLGHVFPDGPEPTGQRYCVNSASLDFEKD